MMIAKADLQLVLSSGAAIRKVMGGGGGGVSSFELFFFIGSFGRVDVEIFFLLVAVNEFFSFC